MALQDFIGIASSAPDPARPQDTAAQIPAALYQRAEQNNRFLMEWRGPTCVWHYPSDYSGGDGVGPSFPKLAFANWAAFGPYRYHVPDVGTGAIPAVDVQIVGTVSTRAVRVAMISNQGLGFIPNSEWLDANAQTISPGLQEILFSDVAVAPGWNDLFLLLESEADWDPLNFATDWFITGSVAADEFSSVPILVSTSGDLAIACPDINKPVPFVAIRFGSALGGNDPLPDLFSAPVYTIALARCDASNPPVVSYAYLAELNDYGQLEGVTNSPSGSKVYWSTLGTLEIYSLAVTPYATHPDKANDPSLRFLQSIGSNVANVYWKGSRLNALRQTQVGSGVPRQLGSDYNGVWKTLSISFSVFTNDEIIRETSISTRERQPTEGAGVVSIEMSIPVIALSIRSPRGSPVIFDCKLELFNVTTGAVVNYIAFDNLAVPAFTNDNGSYLSGRGAKLAVNYWMKRIALLTQSPSWRGSTSVQPWSHDGATRIEDINSTFYPLILRLPLGGLATSPDDWNTIRGSGDLYSVRFVITDFGTQGAPADYIAFGAMTARIDWGT